MKFKEMATVVITTLIAISILIHYVNGCDICVIRNGTDIRPSLKPISSSKEEQTHTIIPLILPSGIAVMVITMILAKSRKRK